MTVFAEGRVENQKLNQTAALLSFGWVFGFQLDSLEKNLFTLAVVTFSSKKPSTYYVILFTVKRFRRVTFFLVNRVEHQKLNQTTAELSFGWVFGVQLGLRQTQALISTNYIIVIKRWRMSIRRRRWRKLNVHILLLSISTNEYLLNCLYQE